MVFVLICYSSLRKLIQKGRKNDYQKSLIYQPCSRYYNTLFYFISQQLYVGRGYLSIFYDQKNKIQKGKIENSCFKNILSFCFQLYINTFFFCWLPEELTLWSSQWLGTELWWSVPTRLVKDVNGGLVRRGPEVSYDLSSGPDF